MHPSSSSSASRPDPHVTTPLVSIPQSNQPTCVSSTPGINETPDEASPSLNAGSRSMENHHLPGEGEELKISSLASVSRDAATSSEMACSSKPIMRHHLDSGLRLPPAVVDVPPVYTEE